MAKILVVDDERLICDLLQAVLSRHGHEVLTATKGLDVPELFRRHRPQITVLDLHLQDTNGIAVLKQIRAVDSKASVIMLTGGGTDELEHRARLLGVTDFLRKGLSLETLVGALDRVTTQPGQPALPTLRAPGKPTESQPRESILVVDDEPSVRDLLSQFLTLRGFRVRTAQNGPEALDLAKQEPPKVVILDLYMPGMNGVEVLRRLQSQNYTGGVVALTASQDENLLLEMLNLGAVDIVGKPVDLERLVLVVEVSSILSSMKNGGPSISPSKNR